MIPNPPPSGATVVEQALNQVFKSTPKRVVLSKTLRLGLGLAVLGVPALSALAADAPAVPSATFSKPNWLTDLSLGIKETYDDNVFLEGNDSSTKGWPKTLPKGYVAAEKDKESFVTTVSPKIGFNFAPLIGDQKTLQSLTLAYNPDFTTYHDASSENNDAHKVIVGAKVKSSDWSASVDNTFTAISGSDYGIIYPGSLNSAYATGTLRERRSQDQDKLNAVVQYDAGDFFLRPTASWVNYDLDTKQLAGVSGYQNYADRYDLNGGADVGYRITKDFAAIAGFREGYQYQQAYGAKIDAQQWSSSSVYQRALFGFEGKPFSWLDFKFLIGPDIRKYSANAAVKDRDYTTYYGESAVTATLSKNDSIVFKYKQYQWVSSTGKSPYFDSLFDLSYKRKIVDGLTFDIGGKLLESDYTSGLNTTGLTRKNIGSATAENPRDDGLWVISAGVTYAINKHASVNLAYNAYLARNLYNDLPSTVDASTREFTDNQVTLGAIVKF